MSRLRKIFSSRHLCFMVSLLGVTFLGSNCFAYDVNTLVNPMGSYSFSESSQFTYVDNTNCRYVPSVYTVVNDNANSTCSIVTMALTSNGAISVQAGDVIELNFHIFTNAGSVSSHSSVGQFKTANDLEVVEQSFEELSTNDGMLKVYVKAWKTMDISYFYFEDARGAGLVNLINSTAGGARMVLGNYMVYRPITGTDNNAIIGAINSQNNTQNSINQNTANTAQGVQNMVNAQNQANQDANNRYDDEKQTIEDNITNGAGIVDQSQLSMSIFNPFMIFQNMEARQCYNINTLSTFIHSPTATYCSWFSPAIRNIFSPFATLFVGLLLFKFGWSWAKKAGI